VLSISWELCKLSISVALSALYVEKVKPQARAFLVWDSDAKGLALQVQPTGHRSYVLVYRHGGRSRWLHLGDARVIGLADARTKAAELMLAVTRDGKDPAAEKKRTGRETTTFAVLADRYVNEHARKRNKSWMQANALVCRYLVPVWGDLSANSITRSDVRGVIGAIDAPILANQVLASASAIFSWAGKQEILTTNPCRGIERNQATSRERVLSDSEMPKFWSAFREAGLPGTALQILLLTGQRPGEVARMRWEHIKADWWELPGAPEPGTGWLGTKNSQAHRVWLPAKVREIVAELGDETSGYVFGSVLPLDATMRSVCEHLKVPRATPHDLRRTHGTTVTALGFGRDAMNRVPKRVASPAFTTGTNMPRKTSA
jgi:integrase